MVFQPHRYSRTKALNKDLAESFSEVDSLYLLPVYSAFEAECEGGMKVDFITDCKCAKTTMLSFDQDGLGELFSNFSDQLKNKERVFLFIGAGSINEFAHAFCALYENPDRQSAKLSTQKRKVQDCVLKLSKIWCKNDFKIGGDLKTAQSLQVFQMSH